MGRGTRDTRTRGKPQGDAPDYIGKRVRAARERVGLTQEQAGVGLSASYVSAVERGKIRPSLAALERIARATGVAVVDLLGVEPEPVEPATTVARALALLENAAIAADADSRAVLEACLFTLRAAAQRLAKGPARTI